MPESEPWSRLPAEIAHEVAGHNADDVQTLRAMSLASKSMRSSSIIHLFSSIHFACAEDFYWWRDMLGRTPTLATVVKKVRFADPGGTWLARHRGYPSPAFATKLAQAPTPPVIPAMPSVCVVEWSDRQHHLEFNVMMATAYMALFPNMTELCLRNIEFGGLSTLSTFLGACKRLKVLSLFDTVVGFPDMGVIGGNGHSTTIDKASSCRYFDLTELEELAVRSTIFRDGEEYLIYLLEHSPPTRLKSLAFGYFLWHENNEPCSLRAMEKLLGHGAPSLTNLTVEPTLLTHSDNCQILRIFGDLPAFPALESLTIWLGPNRQAESLLKIFPAAPNLTRVVFRIIFSVEVTKDSEDMERFHEILQMVFPWGAPESIKSVLTRKFPLIESIGFQFCAPRRADIHFRRDLRRRIELLLFAQLMRTEADATEYLPFEWLDEDYHPVKYSRTNGKPSWMVTRNSWNKEPETEASDYSSADDSDGSLVEYRDSEEE
ncbi:hypothetical protein B0H11DRAFT_1951070 [Mycena galericulata]|nr:hypothetical protein B0H11DRAFT_1951070 [Mycena galericulata]